MGKKKIRKFRWELRGILKQNSNRRGVKKDNHPQVQREMLKEKDEY